MENSNNFEGLRGLLLSHNKIDYDEDSLPSLPLPNLEQTLERYLESVKPFLSNEDFKATQNLVKKFAEGSGYKLQYLLEARAKEKKNWVEEWWLKYAYLMGRKPLLPLSNMAGIHGLYLTKWPPVPSRTIEYLAKGLFLMLEFYEYTRKEKLRPHFSFNGDRLCMNQFFLFFNSTRIPRKDCDQLKCWFKTESEGDCPNHIIILCNGHIWKMVPWDSKGCRLSYEAMMKQFEYVKEQSLIMKPGSQIAALTLAERDEWAEKREWLKALSKRNERNLELVESAICHYAIDMSRPANGDEGYWACLCGLTGNRWADKSYTNIGFESGYVASNIEHSPVDAMVSVIYSECVQDIITSYEDILQKGSEEEAQIPILIKFDIDPFLTKGIQDVKESNFEIQVNIDCRYYTFWNYGKDWMKSHTLHADTFIQCALQLAYFKLHRKLAPTYETATTRQFYHGRTETLRSCTVEMAQFVYTFTSSNASNSRKKSKLKEAMEKHLKNMRDCQSGQGIDRHLFGLYVAAIENGFDIPEIFTDPAFLASGGGGNFVLSTSTVGQATTTGGVVPMVDHGYAIMYSFLGERIQFTVSSFRNSETNLSDFVNSMEWSLLHLKELIEDPAPKI